MKRRELIGVLAGAAAGWPLGATPQQLSMPVVGFLSSLGAADAPRIMPPFRRGLAEAGYAEGHNVAFEYRWAEGEFARLPAMVADLVSRRASVIAAVSGTPAALAAKAATATIPIVFAIGAGPVEVGLVASLSRPGGNITGATFYTALLGAKRLELLRELVPKATTVAVFANAKNPASVVDRSEVETAAPKLGLEVRVFAVGDKGEIEGAFQTLARERAHALYIGPDPIFYNHRNEIAALAIQHRLPAICADRDIAEAGGMLSYGASRPEAYLRTGVYVGRVLKGEKASDLPVMQPTRFELVVNLKTAKALGLAAPPTILARADEIIE